jgi:hypothetical protein
MQDERSLSGAVQPSDSVLHSGKPDGDKEPMLGRFDRETHERGSRSAYTYKALNSKDSTRVIELQGSEDHASELCCRLIEISLDNPPRYSAVSYAWEGQVPTKQILCDEKVLLVTPNCAAALRRFRPSNARETILIWIDGICINQKSTLERNHQVRVMGMVYQKAWKVLIWLGPLQSEHIRCFLYLRDASALAETEASDARDSAILNMTEKIPYLGMSITLAKTHRLRLSTVSN